MQVLVKGFSIILGHDQRRRTVKIRFEIRNVFLPGHYIPQLAALLVDSNKKPNISVLFQIIVCESSVW